MISLGSQSEKPKRTAASLSAKLNKGLVAYVAAASAAGVGGLACVIPADAEVVYTPANRTLTEDHSLGIDFNHDGIIDLYVTIYGSGVSSGGSGEILGSGATKLDLAMLGSQQFLSAAFAGKIIGSEDQFATYGKMASCRDGRSDSHPTFSSSKGPWRNVRDRYLGVKFEIDGQTHYGWARINTMGFPEPSTNARGGTCVPSATLTGYAYESVPDMPIVAGVAPIPVQAINAPGSNREPSGMTPAELNTTTASRPVSLGSLALGATGKSIRKQ